PLYETSFDSWDLDEPEGNANARIENGKLILTSENQEHVSVLLERFSSDRLAVEFELNILEASSQGHCVFYILNEEREESSRLIVAGFFTNSQTNLAYSVGPDMSEDISMSRFDQTKSNTVTLIILGDQIAAFLNGQIAYATLKPDGSVVYTNTSLAATYTIVCEYDNYKLWDLSGLEINP
ncbi:MAG: hypothetical protein MUO76_18390, partial [Anaerolineaceae bacterium]|nr:hypothetical protein [Anaerolineaceae bacterium]